MAARMGMEVVVAHPPGFGLDDDVMRLARDAAARYGGTVRETDDQRAAFEGATAVYAKAWSGQAVYSDPAAEAVARRSLDEWRVTSAKMDLTADDGVFMHCLPVRRGVVVDGDVLDGPRALHLLEAEYRLHAQKAILEWVWDLPPGGSPQPDGAQAAEGA
jgi:N-acetylornithine carbamoyltransferase